MTFSNRRLLSMGVLALAFVAGCANVETSSGQAIQDLHGHHGDPPATGQNFVDVGTIPHGLAADRDVVFVSQPLIGEIDAFDRETGRQIGTIPPPSVGFSLAFALRIPSRGVLAVLDIGGFPTPTTPAIPTIYEYRYRYDHDGDSDDGFSATLSRTISFSPSLPIVFAADFDVTPDGGYVMSESSIGALWLIAPDGTVSEGIFPRSTDPADGIPQLAPCGFPGTTINGIPYNIEGGFAPGAGAITVHHRYVYVASTCTGGVVRVPLSTLHDPSLQPYQRAAAIETVTERAPGAVESLEGLSFNSFDDEDHFLYATDDYHMRIIRIDVSTGERTVVIEDPTLMDFPVQSQFLPPHVHHRDGDEHRAELLVLSDQEYRFSAVNTAISSDMFNPPFVISKIVLGR